MKHLTETKLVVKFLFHDYAQEAPIDQDKLSHRQWHNFNGCVMANATVIVALSTIVAQSRIGMLQIEVEDSRSKHSI